MLILPLLGLGFFVAIQLDVHISLALLLAGLVMALLNHVSMWWMFSPVTLRITQQGNFVILRKRIIRSSQKPDFIRVKSRLLVYLTKGEDVTDLARVPGWWELNIKPNVPSQFTVSGFIYRFTNWIMTTNFKTMGYTFPWYPYLLKPADAEQVRNFCKERRIRVKKMW